MSATYAPCRTGIHVCGISADGQEPITVYNYPISDQLNARTVFNAAENQFRISDGEPADLIVDLMENGDIEVDFPITRQVLEPLKRWLTEGPL